MLNTYLPRSTDSGVALIGFWSPIASGMKAGTGESMRGSMPPSGIVPGGGVSGRVGSRVPCTTCVPSSACTAGCSFICSNQLFETCSQQPIVKNAIARRPRPTLSFDNAHLPRPGGAQQLLDALDLLAPAAHDA